MSEIPDITIAGLGVKAVVQVTAETDRRIRRCQEVLYNDSGVGTAEFLAARCPRVTSLYHASYGEADNRVNAYRSMAAAVIDAAMQRRPVCYLTHGHPIIFCYSAVLVRDLARLLGLTVELLPGISAAACMMADLWLDPGVSGLQMFEATDLLLRRRRLHTDVPALIWQVGNLETRLYTTRPSRPERLHRFRDWLLLSYPPDHPITAYYAAPHPITTPRKWTFPLAEIAQHAPELHPGITLYIPPHTARPIQDLDLLQRLDSRDHLDQITEG